MTHPPRPVTSPARQPARGARRPGPLSSWTGPAPREARRVATAARARGVCGQALAPRSTRRAGCPGGDIVPLRRGVGLRNRLVSLSDIMCDWPSARPPAAGTDAGAGAWAHLRAAGTLLPPPCGLPVSTARPRVSPPRNQDGPRRTAQPWRDPRTGRCSAADHFLCSLRGLFTGERPGWVGPEGGHVPGGAGVPGLPLTLPSSSPKGDRNPPASQG